MGNNVIVWSYLTITFTVSLSISFCEKLPLGPLKPFNECSISVCKYKAVIFKAPCLNNNFILSKRQNVSLSLPIRQFLWKQGMLALL
jgi:hypothetical protein